MADTEPSAMEFTKAASGTLRRRWRDTLRSPDSDVEGEALKDWLATSTYVVPLDDLREHDPESGECWCRPWWDGDILVHNSADGRELSERRPT